MIRKYVLKLPLTDRCEGRPCGRIEIEIASEHDRRACVVSTCILSPLGLTITYFREDEAFK
jgi:hypothetical protein